MPSPAAPAAAAATGSQPPGADAGQEGSVDSGRWWTRRTFRVGWGSREQLSVHLVVPAVVAEVAVEVARDSAGRWRHPVRLTRIRTDMGPDDVPLFGATP